jgi:hypothetical protein
MNDLTINEQIIKEFKNGTCLNFLGEEYGKTIPELKEILKEEIIRRKEVEAKVYDLKFVVENLVQAVQEYKSDTFSSKELEIDKETAEKMAAFLINQQLFDLNRVPGDAIDEAEIGFAYDCLADYEGWE